MSMDSELSRLRARGTSVPRDLKGAQHYAGRLEDRYKSDQVKITHAMARLEAIADGLAPSESSLKFALREVVASLW